MSVEGHQSFGTRIADAHTFGRVIDCQDFDPVLFLVHTETEILRSLGFGIARHEVSFERTERSDPCQFQVAFGLIYNRLRGWRGRRRRLQPKRITFDNGLVRVV